MIFKDQAGRLRWFWRALLLVLFIAIGAAGFIAAWTALELPPQRANGVVNFWPYVSTGGAIFIIALLAIALVMRLTERRPFATIGLKSRNAFGEISVGALLGCLVPAVVVAALYALGHVEIAVLAPDFSAALTRMLPLLVMFVCMAGFEELTLRGYGLQLLIDGVGKWWAVLLSGAAFGLMHAVNPGANPMGLINTAINGMLLALIVVKMGSLVLAWAYHVAWNAFSTFVLGLNVSGHNLDFFALSRVTLSGPELFTGGAYGFEASVLTGPVETMVLFAVYLLAPNADAPNYFERRTLREARTAARISAGSSAAARPSRQDPASL